MKSLSRIGFIAASTVLAVSVISGCGSTESSASKAGSSTPSTTASESTAPSAEASASSGSGETAAAESVVLTIKDFAYSGPGKVAPGTEITVKNDDDAAHTVTADGEGDFDVILQPGKSATFKAPSKAGDYDYHCTYHANMHGTLSVG